MVIYEIIELGIDLNISEIIQFLQDNFGKYKIVQDLGDIGKSNE